MEGIYRISGFADEMDTLRMSLEKGEILIYYHAILFSLLYLKKSGVVSVSHNFHLQVKFDL